ncbi:MAG: flagellar hook-length control protein FliK [Pseudomonadota bacterium]
MNATSVNPASGNGIQPAQQAGKSADNGTPDMPFSQVLSSEIAQNRKSDAPQSGSSAYAKPDANASSADSAKGKNDSKVDSTQPSKTGDKTTHDPDKDKQDAASIDNPTVAPETLLGLPVNPDALKAAAVAAGKHAATGQGATPEAASDRGAAAVAALGAPGVSAQDVRKGGRAIPLTQTAQQAAQHDARQAGSESGTQKLDPRLSGKEATAASTARTVPADAAAAFQGQLAAARHADAVKTGEAQSDLVSNSAIRVTSHTLVDTQLTPVDASSSRLAPSVGTTAWGQALGEKLVWMASGAQQTASLTLNPPNLGPLQIVVHVTNDQVTASFFSAQPDVRHALEAAFPRLRDMMNDAGIQLGQATVSADTPQQNSTPDRQAQRITLPFSGSDPSSSAALQAVQVPIHRSGRGLVDTFA